MLLIVMNAQSTSYMRSSLHVILNVFVELIANDMTYEGLFKTPVLLETLLNGFVINPKRVYPDIVYPELAAILQNLAAIDDIPYLNTLVDAGLPVAIMTLLSEFSGRSMSVTFNCLDAL